MTEIEELRELVRKTLDEQEQRKDERKENKKKERVVSVSRQDDDSISC